MFRERFASKERLRVAAFVLVATFKVPECGTSADGRDAPVNAISASFNAVCNRCWADQTLDEIKHAATEVLRAGRCVDTALRLAAGLSAMTEPYTPDKQLHAEIP